MRTSTIVFALVIWLAAAALFVATGMLARMPFPPPVIVLGLSITTLAAGLVPRAMRQWIADVDVRYLLTIHLVRFVGIAFLVLVRRGTLAPAFAPIGWGDTIAAVGAAALLVSLRVPLTSRGWWALLAWNTLGLADMALLIVTGIRLGFVEPQQFALFRQLPFGLLPTFFVPLIVATHVFVFVRLLTSPGTHGRVAGSP